MGGGEGRLLAMDTAQPQQQQTAARSPLSILAETRLPDGITSIAVHPSMGELIVGTRKSDMFGVILDRQVRIASQMRAAAELILFDGTICTEDAWKRLIQPAAQHAWYRDFWKFLWCRKTA